MGNLSDLIAQQKAKANAPSTPVSNPPVPAVPSASAPAPARILFGGASKPTSPAVSESLQASSGGGLVAEAPIAKLNLAQVKLPVSQEAPAVKTIQSGDFNLDDLADLDVSGIEEQRPIPNAPMAILQGETAATAPTRELPADLEEQQVKFVGLLDSLYEVLFDASLFGQVTKTIMTELQDHPEYIKLIADADSHTIIRGMRESMGLARIKKQEKKTPASRGKKVDAVKHAEAKDALDELFGSDAFD